MPVFIMMVAVACVDVSGAPSVALSASALCLESLRGRWRVCSCCGVRVTYNKGRPGGGDTVASIKAV